MAVTILNTSSNISGKTLVALENDYTITGTWIFSGTTTFSTLVSTSATISGTTTLNGLNAVDIAASSSIGFTAGPVMRSGTGTPEGSVTAPVGSLYLRSNGGASTSLYVKESGVGNTGWVAK